MYYVKPHKPVISQTLRLFLGLAGAAVQLIPTAELSLLSTRQGRTPADLQAESLPPATLAGLPVAGLSPCAVRSPLWCPPGRSVTPRPVR